MDELTERLRIAYLVMDDAERRTLARAGLTPTQHMLRATEALPGDPPVTALAARLLCTRGNVTRLVARTAALGLVQTLDDPDDQRLVRVRLTEAGRDALQRADALLAEAQARRFAHLDEAQRAEALAVLDEVTRAFAGELAAD